MTHSGYVKRLPVSEYRTQRRGGRGVTAHKPKDEDFIDNMFVTSTHDDILFFTDKGKVYSMKCFYIPEAQRTARGRAIVNVIQLSDGEKVRAMIQVKADTEGYIFLATKNGLIKKTTLEEYVQTKKKNGIIALNIKDDDELVSAFLVKDEPIIILTKNGYCIKFNSLEVGATGRATSGVKAINLTDGDCVAMGLALRNSNDELAIFSGNGLGKKIKQEELIPQKRGGRGVICYKTSSMTGDVIAGVLVEDEDNVLIVGETKSICISAKEIPSLSRAATGNQMIKNGKVKSVSKV
jgi:DNA gyrase subunit A